MSVLVSCCSVEFKITDDSHVGERRKTPALRMSLTSYEPLTLSDSAAHL